MGFLSGDMIRCDLYLEIWPDDISTWRYDQLKFLPAGLNRWDFYLEIWPDEIFT